MSFLGSITESTVSQTVAEGQRYLDPVRQFIFDNFGQNGVYAAYLLAGAIVALIIYKLIKLGFDVVFFVALPAVLAAFVLTFFLPYGFIYLLPATTALFTLGLVMKNVGFSKG